MKIKLIRRSKTTPIIDVKTKKHSFTIMFWNTYKWHKWEIITGVYYITYKFHPFEMTWYV